MKKVFDYGHKTAANQMRTPLKKLVQNVGTKYRQDISKKLNNKIKVNIFIPVHSTQVMVRHVTREALVSKYQSGIQTDQREQTSMISAAVTAEPSGTDLPTKIMIMDSNIAKGDYDLSIIIPIDMTESEKAAYENDWRTYQERNSNIEKHRVQAY